MKNIKANLRALGTQVEAAQRAASSAGVKCMISSVRIYERLDKT